MSQLSISTHGSKENLAAFEIELLALGFQADTEVADGWGTKATWGEHRGDTDYLIAYHDGSYSYHNHEGFAVERVYELPTDYSEAVEAAQLLSLEFQTI